MSRKKFSGKALVIQLSSDQLRIAKMSLNSTVPAVQATFIADLPEGTVVDGVIHNVDVVRMALQSALETPELKRVKRVIFSLCTTQVIAEETSLPPVSPSKLDKMLAANMDMYFPVDTQNYHLAWEITEKKNDKGEMTVQLWAVSTSIVHPYYLLANTCGLSVLAIDYCGHALATAVGASFSVPEKKAPKKAKALAVSRKKGEQPEEELYEQEQEFETAPAADTDLYLMAEREHLLMLFVQEGHVKLQRMFLCGPNMESELSEVLMALDYYDSMQMGSYGSIRCNLCGALAEDEDFVALARDVLGIPVTVLPTLYPSVWTLPVGAAQTTLDFGIPSLNQTRGAGQINNAWQYSLILAGGAALAMVMVATLGSKAIWTTTINGLENTKQTLQIQAAQNANYAQNYYTYRDAYQRYSSDWDTVHGSLRTYNDNLVLMIDELEDVLPKGTSVTGIQIAGNGLSLGLASESKEEAAYTIMALRELQYASLDAISDLVKPTYESAPLVGSSSSIDYSKLLGILGGASQNNNNSGSTSNSLAGMDLSSLTPEQIQMIQNAYNSGLITDEMIAEMLGNSSGSGTTTKPSDKDIEDALKDALSKGELSQDSLLGDLFNLTPEQMDALEKNYAQLPSDVKKLDLDDLIEDATFEQRQKAMETMLNEDPIAMYRLFRLIRTDLKRPVKEAVLDDKVYDTVWADTDLVFAITSGDLEDAKKAAPELVKALVADEDCLSSAEKLIQEDKKLAQRYAYYLAVEMGEMKKSDKPVFDTSKFITDMVTGNVDDSLKEILDKIKPDYGDLLPDFDFGGSGGLGDLGDLGNLGGLGNLGDLFGDKDKDKDKDKDNNKNDNSGSSDELPDWMQEILGGNTGNSGSSGSSGSSDQLPDWIWDVIGGQGSSGSMGGMGGMGGMTQQPDTRYHYTVILGYKDALIQAERERKGLNYDAKVAELEVDA